MTFEWKIEYMGELKFLPLNVCHMSMYMWIVLCLMDKLYVLSNILPYEWYYVNPLKLIAALHVLFETLSYNHLDSMYEELWVVKICYLSVSCLLSYCHDYMTSWIICLNLCYVNRFIEHKLCGIHVLNNWKQNLPWEHVILWCIRLIYVVFCYVLKDIYLTFDYMNSWLYVNLLALKLEKLLHPCLSWKVWICLFPWENDYTWLKNTWYYV